MDVCRDGNGNNWPSIADDFHSVKKDGGGVRVRRVRRVRVREGRGVRRVRRVRVRGGRRVRRVRRVGVGEREE